MALSEHQLTVLRMAQVAEPLSDDKDLMAQWVNANFTQTELDAIAEEIDKKKLQKPRGVRESANDKKTRFCRVIAEELKIKPISQAFRAVTNAEEMNTELKKLMKSTKDKDNDAEMESEAKAKKDKGAKSAAKRSRNAKGKHQEKKRKNDSDDEEMEAEKSSDSESDSDKPPKKSARTEKGKDKDRDKHRHHDKDADNAKDKEEKVHGSGSGSQSCTICGNYVFKAGDNYCGNSDCRKRRPVEQDASMSSSSANFSSSSSSAANPSNSNQGANRVSHATRVRNEKTSVLASGEAADVGLWVQRRAFNYVFSNPTKANPETRMPLASIAEWMNGFSNFALDVLKQQPARGPELFRHQVNVSRVWAENPSLTFENFAAMEYEQRKAAFDNKSTMDQHSPTIETSYISVAMLAEAKKVGKGNDKSSSKQGEDRGGDRDRDRNNSRASSSSSSSSEPARSTDSRKPPPDIPLSPMEGTAPSGKATKQCCQYYGKSCRKKSPCIFLHACPLCST